MPFAQKCRRDVEAAGAQLHAAPISGAVRPALRIGARAWPPGEAPLRGAGLFGTPL